MSEDSVPPEYETPTDPIRPMVSTGLELHEMYLALIESGFQKKEALYMIGIAVASGVMLPMEEFGYEDMNDDMSFDEDGDDLDGDLFDED